MAFQDQNKFLYALSSNQAWAGYKSHQNPAFFKNLATGQSPSILWLGCSDSRVPETTILGLQPGDVFVHRNIANIVAPTDINTSAVIEYAVTHLKVKHVVLCGHSACGGAKAALGDSRVGGVLDTWLTPLKAVRAQNIEELAAIKDEDIRAIRIAEMNVEAGVRVLMANFAIQEAVKERGLTVHGCLFDIASGRIRDLGFGTRGVEGRGMIANGDEDIVRGKHAQLVFRDGDASMQVQ
ncbi:carbonic anhydrase [Colletotrichum chrysophilum]|uniref:Carbonic anhydrase n=1 Tax=Colletotrichum chrysophilum TaxID=1836956 RepID=A0AAD9EA10_9PEZI|nr:Carbonic anhydrase [Colletotrichum siamense]KAF4861835.1 Carbonic anhydrase [Colletotrichum siamense]KAF5484458.1 Carbonic anhydrase [Colletotrichum siamense]KAK1840092.1 carbonic anhydrase [Colletotrichum chrysophilum]